MGIFKAYDIRGVYPTEIHEDLARKIGFTIAQVLGAKAMVVGRDMRISSPSLAQAASEGIRAAGADVISIGEVTTPTTYFALGRYGYPGAIMVTASHNPGRYNGMKVSREGALPMGYETGLAEVERRVAALREVPGKLTGGFQEKNLLPEYADYLRGMLVKPAPLTLAVDAGNGMGGTVARLFFEGLPYTVHPLYFEPDGRFPNHEANPLKQENLRDLIAKVKETKADLGVAFDGDADRLVFVDENAEPVPSDLLTALLARDLLREAGGGAVVYDLRSSRVVAEEIRKAGGRAIRERVGHAIIKNRMRKEDAVFGGELSGHYYFKKNFFADSGFVAMTAVLNILAKERSPLSRLMAPLRRYAATGEVNFEVEDKDGKIDALARAFPDGKQDRLDGITVEFPDWWFNVRKSNTEPILRLNLEAKDASLREEALKRVLAVLEQ